MRVYVYGDSKLRDLGAIRFEVEWITIKEKAKNKTDVDPDLDTITHVEYFDTESEAITYGQGIYSTTELYWGVVTIQKQVVDWYVEEDRIAEWTNVGNSLEINN